MPVVQNIALGFEFLNTACNKMRLNFKCFSLFLPLLLRVRGIVCTQEVDLKRPCK